MADPHVCGPDCTSMKLSCRMNRAAAKAAQEATMPAKSKAQQRFMAMCAHGTHPKGECPDKETAREFAKTPHKGLPERAPKKKR